MGLALVLTLLPSVMLSGFIFPLASMPLPLQVIGMLMPATHYLKIIRGVMVVGVGWSEVWHEFAILIGMGLVFILIGMKKFSNRLS
jgi:ABC-2 type transport system permease protein